ncbi:MAG: RNA polymerase sigma factor [Nitrososphaerales archaeon]
MLDADTAARAYAGDPVAWDALVAEHQQDAFRLAYLYLGDAAEAEDVSQEAFVRAFRAFHRFDRSRPFRPWLLTIVANLARNRRRALGRYLAAWRRLAETTSDRAATGGQAESWRSQALWQAVRRLSRQDQEVIYLRYYLELPESETASILQIAPGTVKSRLHRGLARLRDVARREFPELEEG